MFLFIITYHGNLTVQHSQAHFIPAHNAQQHISFSLVVLHYQVSAKLKDGSAFRVALIATLLSAATKYIRAKRVMDGVALEYARTARPLSALVMAALTAVMLAPLHALASKLVFGKVRSALGVRQVAISGGGSLATHLDDFYEAIGLPVLNGWGLSETSPVLACRRALPLQVGYFSAEATKNIGPRSIIQFPTNNNNPLMRKQIMCLFHTHKIAAWATHS